MAEPRQSAPVSEGAGKLSWKTQRGCSVPALISICVYAISGPCIIIVNKTIIKDHGLHAPALVSSMGILFTALFTHLAALLGLVSITPIRDDPKSAAMPIVSVGMCTAFSFLLGNKAYIYLGPGFLQMMKAATPALLMAALIVFRIEKISLSVSVCSLVMVGGSVMAALHTPHLNAIGIFIQLGSMGGEVMQNVMLQFFMQRLCFSALDAGYYIAPMSTLCCFILSYFLESETLLKDGGELLMSQVWWLCASGIVGVAVNFSSFFVIQFISSLMAKLIVVARSAGLVCVLILVWNEEWKPLQLVGYTITLIAFGGYSWLKVSEKNPVKVAAAETSPAALEGGGSPKNSEDDARSDDPLMGDK